jgi:hypothetical protein
VDACNEHVGQGGGQPHFHGDSFGCQYTAADYTSVDMHPPVIGWSYDGYDIRGRHLSESAPGYNAPLLDDCGGHVHDSDPEALGYHYHTQVHARSRPGQLWPSDPAHLDTTPSRRPLRCHCERPSQAGQPVKSPSNALGRHSSVRIAHVGRNTHVKGEGWQR